MKKHLLTALTLVLFGTGVVASESIRPQAPPAHVTYESSFGSRVTLVESENRVIASEQFVKDQQV